MVDLCRRRMSDANSEKEKGNAAFRREDFTSALKHYDNAIRIAGSDAGASLFSNKAAALLKLAKHDACIQQCIKGLAAPGLTSDLKTKIFCRMATAYEAQGKVDEAMEALRNGEFSPTLLEKYSDLLSRLWRHNPSAMRDFCNNQLQHAHSSGADTTAISMLMERVSTEHNKEVLLIKRDGLPLASVSIESAGGSGHVCTALLCDLKPISIGQLRLGEVNVGRLLICRTIAEPVTGINKSLIEDPTGAVTRIVLSKFCSPNEDINNVLPIGAYLAVKEPWYKTVAADGKPAIKVYSLADIMYLEQTHSLLKDVEWRTNAAGTSASVKSNDPACWESLQKRGNEFFKARNYELAIAAYADAIELKRKVAPKEVADLLSNRAAAYLANEMPADAFWDCESALFVQPGHLKATFRLAKAHVTLGNYEEAKGVLEKSSSTTRPEFQAEIARLNRLMREKQYGDYDLKSLLKEAAASKTPRLDHADYNGGVEMRWISQERGNGLVALRDFAPGDLLFVNKAFEATYKSEWNADPNADYRTLPMADPSLDLCVSRINRRISKNKDLVTLDESEAPAVDSTRVAAIVSQNTIGSCDLQVQAEDRCDLRSFDEVRSGFYFGGRGLWILEALTNHSCVPNTARFFVGDFIFVRASKRIAKGEELTSSYSDSASDYEERQAFLALAYGFKCKCELCVCDLKRARDQPSLLNRNTGSDRAAKVTPAYRQYERQREAAVKSLNALSQSRARDTPASFAAFVEAARVLAEEFSLRLAYKNRYDLGLKNIYETIGKGFCAQQQWLMTAKAFEVAYSAVVGTGTQTADTLSYDFWCKYVIFLCFKIASSYLLALDFAKAKEYLGKVQRAAKLAWGSDDEELLAMLYPGVPVEKLFEDVFGK